MSRGRDGELGGGGVKEGWVGVGKDKGGVGSV